MPLNTVPLNTVPLNTVLAVAVPLIDPRFERPEWLGTRILDEFAPGSPYGITVPTPEIMIDRRFATVDLLPPPVDDVFAATLGPVPEDVVARSMFTDACPVRLDELTYIEMTFWGFDERPHTGEMIVNADVAEDVVRVFELMYEARFAIEEMRVMTHEDFSRPPTGDDNITSSFECRPAVGGSGGWSNHAFGLAIDINPFHNPYRKGSLVLPELASAYFDRSHERPGMVLENDQVVRAFTDLGWGWGGNWSSALDYMHFSWNGR